MSNAGALNFTLGLQANQFLNSLNIASGKLIGFLGVSQGIRIAFNQMWDAVQQGGRLTDLAASASLTVKELYQLQQAFENVGASAESVPQAINFLRRTLGEGLQNDVIKSIGLDPESLGRMKAAEQFTAVAAALAKVNVNARSAAAQNLFGRGGAAIIQMIANSGNDFADAMQRASKDADVWQQVSAAFDQIADKVTELQKHIKTQVALLTGGLVQAFKEGQLAEAIMDILITGMTAAFVALPSLAKGAFTALGAALLKAFETPLVYLKSMLEASLQGWIALISKIPGLRDLLGVTEGFTPDSFGTIVNRNKAEGINFFGANEADMSKYAASQVQAGLKDGMAVLDGLSERLGALAGRLDQSKKAGTLDTGETGGKLKEIKTGFTDVEKMGGVLAGLGRGFGGDEGRQTAQNTGKLVALAKETNDLLKASSAGNFANI